MVSNNTVCKGAHRLFPHVRLLIDTTQLHNTSYTLWKTDMSLRNEKNETKQVTTRPKCSMSIKV